jgi:hypothetical protein
VTGPRFPPRIFGGPSAFLLHFRGNPLSLDGDALEGWLLSHSAAASPRLHGTPDAAARLDPHTADSAAHRKARLTAHCADCAQVLPGSRCRTEQAPPRDEYSTFLRKLMRHANSKHHSDGDAKRAKGDEGVLAASSGSVNVPLTDTDADRRLVAEGMAAFSGESSGVSDGPSRSVVYARMCSLAGVVAVFWGVWFVNL